jgi:hypothetical protein
MDLEKKISQKPNIAWTKPKGEEKFGWFQLKEGPVFLRFYDTPRLNKFIEKNPHIREAMQELYAMQPTQVLLSLGLRKDGSFEPDIYEKVDFAVKRSVMQRLVDARNDALRVNVKSSMYTIPGSNVSADVGVKGSVAFDEDFRIALLEHFRSQRKNGTIVYGSPGSMAEDTWGTMGFVANNSKTWASADFTTVCPQIYFHKGCRYCYRREQLATDSNNKLGGETVWYTGEILRLTPKLVKEMNKVGGLRIQSFGDWRGEKDPSTKRMLLDMMYDASMVGLQCKIITKDPAMVDFVAQVWDQQLTHKKGRVVGEYVFFNLSADYFLEPAGGASMQESRCSGSGRCRWTRLTRSRRSTRGSISGPLP